MASGANLAPAIAAGPHVEVLVAEGTVAVDQPGTASIADPDVRSLATPLALVDRGNRTSVSVEPISETRVYGEDVLRVPRLEFTTTSLRNVLERLEGYNRTRAVLVDPELGD